MLGDDNLVLATDTPHWDSSPPGEVTRPILESNKLTEENKRKILGENAAGILN